jgi:hypothetical protein
MQGEKKEDVVRQAMEKMTDAAFRHMTCAQIESDAQRAGVELNWKNTDDLESIQMDLREVLSDTEKKQPQAFFQWMYLLDVPERAFSHSMQADPSMHQLAIIVVQRAAFKVFFRTHWKG